MSVYIISSDDETSQEINKIIKSTTRISIDGSTSVKNEDDNKESSKKRQNNCQLTTKFVRHSQNWNIINDTSFSAENPSQNNTGIKKPKTDPSKTLFNVTSRRNKCFNPLQKNKKKPLREVTHSQNQIAAIFHQSLPSPAVPQNEHSSKCIDKSQNPSRQLIFTPVSTQDHKSISKSTKSSRDVSRKPSQSYPLNWVTKIPHLLSSIPKPLSNDTSQNEYLNRLENVQGQHSRDVTFHPKERVTQSSHPRKLSPIGSSSNELSNKSRNYLQDVPSSPQKNGSKNPTTHLEYDRKTTSQSTSSRTYNEENKIFSPLPISVATLHNDTHTLPQFEFSSLRHYESQLNKEKSLISSMPSGDAGVGFSGFPGTTSLCQQDYQGRSNSSAVNRSFVFNEYYQAEQCSTQHVDAPNSFEFSQKNLSRQFSDSSGHLPLSSDESQGSAISNRFRRDHDENVQVQLPDLSLSEKNSNDLEDLVNSLTDDIRTSLSLQFSDSSGHLPLSSTESQSSSIRSNLQRNHDGVNNNLSRKRKRVNHMSSSDSESEMDLNISLSARNSSIDSSPGASASSHSNIADDHYSQGSELRKRTRRRRAAPEKWTRNHRKIRRNLGKAYSVKNKRNNSVFHPARRLKPPCGCINACRSKITEGRRKKIFQQFWKLGSADKRRELIGKLINICSPKRRRGCGRIRRRYVIKYHLKLGNQMVNVCKKFFLNTLCVGERSVAVAVQKLKRSITGALSPDRRGRHVPANKLSEDVMENIKNHIESFPIVDPHYCRRDSKKRYIEGTLNKTKLYELYQIWCRRRNMIPASKPVYERVLEELNIGFHQPKKDECWHVAFERLPAEERSAEDQEKYELHMRRKEAAESEKQKDKQLASSDTKVMTIAIDMEALLFSPLLLATPAYYARKFFSSNFTIFDTTTKAGFCYVWGENEGRRGAQEVATCLQKFIDEEVPNSITHLNIYADNCPGQNKNSIVTVALGYVVQLHPSLQEINLKFLEPGHTYQEVDCIHSTIETAAKKELIYEPNDWLKIIRHAKRKGHPYVVTKMTHDDFYDFKHMKEKCLGSTKKFSDGSPIRWTDARWIKLKKNSKGSIYIKSDYADSRFKRIGLKNFFPSSKPRRLYNMRLSISKAKYNDLMNLCRRGVIPRKYHNFYQNLTHDEDLRDVPQEFDGVGRLPRR